MKRSKEKSFKIIGVVLLIILTLGLIIGLFFLFYKSGSIASFYIKINDEQLVYDSIDNFHIETGKTYKFEPIYVFDGQAPNNKDFSYKIVSNDSNENNKFSFLANSGNYVFYNLDFTDYFSFSKENDYFLLTSSFNSLEDLLDTKYDSKITIQDDYIIQPKENDYLSLLIYSYDNSKSVRINFNLDYAVQSIVLEESTVIF